MDRAEVERVLAESLSTPPDTEELLELLERLRIQEEQLAPLRELPLGETEPSFTPLLEEPS